MVLAIKKFKICNKKWYVIDSASKGNYSHPDPIKVLTKPIESSLCDYSDLYSLVTGNITVTRTIAVPKKTTTHCSYTSSI